MCAAPVKSEAHEALGASGASVANDATAQYADSEWQSSAQDAEHQGPLPMILPPMFLFCCYEQKRVKLFDYFPHESELHVSATCVPVSVFLSL